MSHRVEIQSPSDTDDVRTLTEGEISSVEFSREHTAMSDFEARMQYDTSVEAFALGEVNIYYDDRHLFRGTLEQVESDDENLEGAGAKVRELIQDHITSRGIEVLNDEPVSIMEEVEYDAKVEGLERDRKSTRLNSSH